MAILLRCPECATSLRVAAAPTAGQKVKCPKCGNAFSPEARTEEVAPRPAVAPPRAAPAPVPAPLDLPDGDDEKPVRKPAAKARREEADEDERPAPRTRARRDRDDDEDRRPSRQRNRSAERTKSGGGLLIGLVVAFGFVALVAVGGLVWLLSDRKAEPESAANPPTDKPAAVPNNPNPAPNPNPVPNPVPDPITNPLPNAAAVVPSKDLLERTKRATALIRVDGGNQGATGSGFLVRSNPDAAYVVTNFHVISLDEDEPAKADPAPGFPGRPPGFPGRPPSVRPPRFGGPQGFGPPGFGGPAFGPPGFGPKQPAARPKPKVYVVLNSGTAEEQSHPAEVVASDPEADLAVLRITGARNVPAPLDVSREAPVQETMPVFIFGHPGGDKNVKVGEGKVIQLRRDASGMLDDVQLAGELVPGNSGGPVVDTQGRLIGVAVATVRGKNIGFAIPATQLDHMLKGSVRGGIVCQVRQFGTRIDATGEIWLLDRKCKVLSRDSVQGTVGESPTPISVPPNEFLVMAALNDPMHKINAVKAHYAPAAAAAAKPEPAGWAALPGAQTVALTVRDDQASGTFMLPAGTVADDTFAFQFSYTNADGRTVYTQPHPLRLTFPKNPKSVTLRITAPADDPSRRYVEDTVTQTFTGVSVRSVRTPQGMSVEIDPIDDPKAVVEKIKFGVVVAVEGRTITVNVASVVLPLPTDQDLALALTDLKSPDANRRRAGADRLSKVYAIVPERREEIAKVLEAAVLDKDIFLRLPALRALNMWSGPENVPGLLRGLEIGEGQTKVGICGILAKYKDPQAAAALAKLLPGLFERKAASDALKAIGPPAEKAVIPYLTHKDSWTSSEACHILKEIGTEESIAPLQEVLKGKPDFMVGPAASNALKSIQERKKKADPK